MNSVYHITKSHHGGGGLYALHLSNAIKSIGFESHFRCLDNSTLTPRKNFLSTDYSLIDRALHGVVRRITNDTFHTFYRISEFELQPNPSSGDIIHLHSITGFIGARGLRKLIQEGQRVFWTAHNPWLFTGGCVAYKGCNSFENQCCSCPILGEAFKLLSTKEYNLKRRFIQDYNVQVIANSHWMASMIRRSPLFEHQIQIPIITPIVQSVFNATGERANIKEMLGINSEQFVIGLSASSLTDEGKGIAPFFENLPVNANWLRNVTFLLIGDGKIQISARIKAVFTGAIKDSSQLAALYRVCDAFVSPSFMETFGMAILEAQACGTPVVAFETGGTPEAVSNHSSCHLVPNRDFKQMNERLEDLILRTAIDEKTRLEVSKKITENFNAKRIAKQQIDIYHNLHPSI